MTNSLFTKSKIPVILLASLFLIGISSFTQAANRQKSEKTEFPLKFSKASVVAVADFKEISLIADLPGGVPKVAEATFSYLKPVNDAKPDNTNFQLVRKRTLNLRTTMRDC